MPAIGYLNQEGEGVFAGRLRTLTHNLRLSLVPVDADDKRGEDSPDFTAYAVDGGDNIPLGSGWKKQRRDVRGQVVGWFISLTLDDPSFPAPLNVAAFPGDATGAPWQVVWNRPRQQNREAA